MKQNIGWGTDTESPYHIAERMDVYGQIAPDMHTYQRKDSNSSFRLTGMGSPFPNFTYVPSCTTAGTPSVDLSHLKLSYSPIKKTRDTPIENISDFIDAYLNNNILFEDDAYSEIRGKCSKILKSEGWAKVYGEKTIDEIMDEIRGRR